MAIKVTTPLISFGEGELISITICASFSKKRVSALPNKISFLLSNFPCSDMPLFLKEEAVRLSSMTLVLGRLSGIVMEYNLHPSFIFAFRISLKICNRSSLPDAPTVNFHCTGSFVPEELAFKASADLIGLPFADDAGWEEEGLPS